MATVIESAPVVPATFTFGGAPINNITKGLPKVVDSICPEPGCAKVIRARLFEESGKVYMEKTCDEHGYVRDLYWSDVELYLKAERWHFGDVRGLSNPSTTKEVCPRDCGLCQEHTNHTVLGNIDLTNRCNLSCPICFANANASGRIYEPTKEEVFAMLDLYQAERPVGARAVQFSGGEPTMHPDFFEIVKATKVRGFAHVQIASNGLKFAEQDFADRAAESGLHTIYLQFDGLDDAVYLKTRGRPLLDIKLKAVEAIRRAGMMITYVPTIARGINDDQVGRIVQFAIDNIDVSSGISFQPVSCTGRISYERREQMRFTLPDLAEAVGTQTGYTCKDDWYPISVIAPLSRMMAAVRGSETLELGCHPHCALGTYLAVEPGTKRPVAVPRFIDIDRLMPELVRQADAIRRARIKWLAQRNAMNELRQYFKPECAPAGLDLDAFMRAVQGMTNKAAGRWAEQKPYSMLLVAGMHFMDAYNYELERVRRCVIHYATPGGRIIPFCAYNTGHTHRTAIESQFSMSRDEYRARRATQGRPLPVGE